MRRLFAFAFSLIAYASFGFSLLYLLGFLLDIGPLPVTVDSGPGLAAWKAVAIDVLLIAGFGAQHSVMARPGFKRAWTRIVPATIERSTYVLISSAATSLLCWGWRPIPQLVWSAAVGLGTALWWGGFVAGFVVLVGASFHIDHFELLGLRQTWSALRGRPCPSPPFRVRGLYKLVRHPIYVGWLLLFWEAPRMSVGHLLLAAGMTAYVLIAIRFEERDLVREHGEAYAGYRDRVPALLPRPSRRPAAHARNAERAARCAFLIAVAALLGTVHEVAHAAGVMEHIAFESGGRTRSALVYLPPGGERAADHLVVMLHGAGGNAERIRRFTAYGLERTAEAGAWLVAYPEGVGGNWNDCRQTPPYRAKRLDVNDVEFLAELIERLRARYSVAPGGVLVAGFSNGGQMAMRLALERPDVVGAIAVVAAQLPAAGESVCSGKPPALSSLWIKGGADPFLPSSGGLSRGARGESLGAVLSIGATVDAFLQPLRPVAERATRRLPDRDGNVSTSVEVREWISVDGRILRLYVLEGSGHVVPQRLVDLPAVAGEEAGDADFGEIVLDFMTATAGDVAE